ncbi:MAG: dihydropteroate synthase [Myxococcales bacterium]|nr:dihydropteroate synthase [Myxococcales bacterium]MCB9642455.1 dihydropteroate synthase [Myxococcales bacterium]
MVWVHWSVNVHPWGDISGWLDSLEDQVSLEPWSALSGRGPLRRVRLAGLAPQQAQHLCDLHTHELQGIAQSFHIADEMGVYLDGDPLRIARLIGLLGEGEGSKEIHDALQQWWERVSHPPEPWEIRGQCLDWRSRPALMGIVNVTPDSFSDGGRFFDPQAAIEHGLSMVEAGAVILDVGGESTRPGADAVSEQDELKRVLPVIEGLRKHTQVAISVDTYKAQVARASLQVGADIINDISGLRFEPQLAEVVAEAGAYLILMHSRHTPREMQRAPHFDQLWSELYCEISRSLEKSKQAGIARERIALDPGIGFGKRLQDNTRILRESQVLRGFGLPVLIGASRKSFLGHLSKEADASKRMEGSLAAAAAAMLAGTQLLRVHDVVETRKLLDVLAAIWTSC